MTDLFQRHIDIALPTLKEIEGRLLQSRIEKRGHAGGIRRGSIEPFSLRSIGVFVCDIEGIGSTVILKKKTAADLGNRNAVIVPDYTNEDDIESKSKNGNVTWLYPKPIKSVELSIENAQTICSRVLHSWDDAFLFKHEVRDALGAIVARGLRPPQIGALHAILAHWSVSKQPATIVMPTGTGKTETMLAILTAEKLERVLVVVPNAALRDQIAEKFLSLGILKAAGVLKESSETPIVATLEGRPNDPGEVDEIFHRANVIVTTMQVAGQCSPEVQERMAEVCSHLFIDEAHHIAAKTWQAFKSKFAKKVVLQFTATPFRTDGKRVDGKFIYVYPLSKAQEEGYFRPINFKAVQGLEQAEADNEIIRRVASQLSTDLDAGFDHLVMARAQTIDRARALHILYRDRLPEHNPVLIHSQMSKAERTDSLNKLRTRESRIIVCVDMLGEGFDLPQLKISGLHDRHKSVAITLQFTGRFTRDSENIGDATVIANIEQSDVDDALRSLYAEDADWNFLLKVLSDSRTGKQLKRAELLEGFSESLEGIPLQTLLPKMSTVIYKTECEEWRPDDIDKAIPSANIHTGPVINDAQRIAVFVTRDEAQVRWSTTKEVVDVQWNLFLVHWDVETKLLYINSSKSGELHEGLAKAIGGEQASRVTGEPVYRVLDGVKRLMLANLGLSSVLGRHIRYTMFIGADITAQISDAQYASKRKSNLFGLGFSGDGKLTIGCSAKGKFWSMQSASDFSDWVEWCHNIGRKVTDETIPTDAFLRNLVKPTQIYARPEKPALTILWPEMFLVELEERIELKFGENEAVGFYECDIQLTDHNETGPIRFTVSYNDHSSLFELRFSPTGVTFHHIEGPVVRILKGKDRPLVEVFNEDPPHIHFADGDFLFFNELFSVPREEERRVFSTDKIEARDWSGVSLNVESQGIEKRPESIQRSIVEELIATNKPYTVVFDDDGSGEIADIVAMYELNDCLHIDLFHLKYAHGAVPGNRVADLYEVCGQAQKSVRWMEYPVRILKRMLVREKDRIEAGITSRFEKGDAAIVRDWKNRWKLMERRYRVWIVQPGLSKSTVEPKQLDLLAATENYLLETYTASLHVIASE